MNEVAKARLRQKLSECTVENECILWAGAPDTNGYGRFYYGPRSSVTSKGGVKAFNAVYELMVGPIPEGLELDHLCRNKLCVNPQHLEPVTHRENVLRGTGGAAVNARKTHCIHGHEFTGDNLIVVKKRGKAPSRRCRTCKNEAHKLRMRRLRTEGKVHTSGPHKGARILSANSKE